MRQAFVRARPIGPGSARCTLIGPFQTRFIGRRLLALALWIELRREIVYDLVENCPSQLGARTLLPHDDVGPEYPTLSGPDPDSAPASETRGSSLVASLLISGTEPMQDAVATREQAALTLSAGALLAGVTLPGASIARRQLIR
jgi:hypothetical protein